MFWLALHKPFSVRHSFLCSSGYISKHMNLPHQCTQTNHYCLAAPAFFSNLNEQEGRKGRLLMLLLSQRYSHFKPDDTELHKRDALIQEMPDIFLCGRLNCHSRKAFIYTLLKKGSSKHNNPSVQGHKLDFKYVLYTLNICYFTVFLQELNSITKFPTSDCVLLLNFKRTRSPRICFNSQ